MKPYELGDPDLDERIRQLAADAVSSHGDTHIDQDLIHEMIVTSLKMQRDHAGRADLKLANSALKEMRYAFMVFSRYRGVRKVTMFGSARTPPHDPNYVLASEFAAHMSDERGWMVVTGAGPGIMEAGNLGAGEDLSFGVNIRLPFEAAANPYVHESRLVNFKYFFTRKLMFVKESDAFALFPGGFGTQDETFELLTLMQTGKSDLHPIVLMEAPGTGYWQSWLDFVTGGLLEQGMIAPNDLALFEQAADPSHAARIITDFYRGYDSQRFVGDTLVLRLTYEPGDELIQRLNDEFTDMVVSGTIERTGPHPAEVEDEDKLDLHRIQVHFDRRSLGRLRAMIDTINEAAPEEPAPEGR
jgi:hypothetical protein